MDPRNLHVTLHYLGQVTGSFRACVHAAAQTVNAEPFQLDLDRFGCFPRAKILWMGSQAVPAQLMHLHKNLGIAITDCGFKYDERPFTPHVTLMRKYNKTDNDQLDFTIPWAVNDFVLVESIQDKMGVCYRVLERYPMQ